MAKKKEELDGVWRTIGGRRVFIKNGQSLSDAMKESGKFKTGNRREVQVALAKEREKKLGKENKDIWDKTNKFDNNWYDENGKLTKEGQKLYEKRKKNSQELRDISQYYREYSDNHPIQWRDDRYNEPEEYEGNTSKLEGKHITGKETKKTYNLKAQSYFGSNDLGEWEGKDFEEAKASFLKENPTYENGKYGHITGSEIKDKYSEALDNVNKRIENKNFRNAESQKYAEMLKAQLEYDKTHLEKKEQEYDLFKRAKENPDSIDPMTENSTDWHELEAKYGERYLSEIEKDNPFRKKEKEKVPRASGSKDFSEYGIDIREQDTKERFSDYLRDKYGTDDFRIISYDDKKKAQEIYHNWSKENEALDKYYKAVEKGRKAGLSEDTIFDNSIAGNDVNKYEKYIDDQIEQLNGRYERAIEKGRKAGLSEDTIFDNSIAGNSISKYEKYIDDQIKGKKEKTIRGSDGRAIDFNRKDDTFKYNGSYNDNMMNQARRDSIMIEELGSKAVEEIRNGNITDESQLNDYLNYGSSPRSKAKPGYGYGYYELQSNSTWRDDLRNTKAYEEITAQADYWTNKTKSELQQRTLPQKYKGTYEYLQKTTNMSGTEILELLKKMDEDKK